MVKFLFDPRHKIRFTLMNFPGFCEAPTAMGLEVVLVDKLPGTGGRDAVARHVREFLIHKYNEL